MTLHRGLITAGYTWLDTVDLPKLIFIGDTLGGYLKKFETSIGIFEVLLVGGSKDGSRLPTAYITSCPEELLGRALPHVSAFQTLCYVDNDNSDWDPVDKIVLAVAIDKQIQKTLDGMSNEDTYQFEYQSEFINYWTTFREAYSFLSPESFLDQKRQIKFQTIPVQLSSKIETQYEIVVYDKDSQLEGWKELRNSTDAISSGDVVAIKVSSRNLSPKIWPPNTLSEIFSWLRDVDITAHNALASKLLGKARKRLAVILVIENEGSIGFRIDLSDRVRELLKSHPLSKKSKRKKPVAKLTTVLPTLTSKYAVEYFSRFNVSHVDYESLYLRNRKFPALGDLANQKICLIGCGTIGGYLAELLVKVGAGRGQQGCLTIFDGDKYKPANYSRHSLDPYYFGWNKAAALADKIVKREIDRLNIVAFERPFEAIPENLEKFDIVIDVTGRPPVAKMLSHNIRSDECKQKPWLIHGYNDGYGRASVVLVDDGTACYGCLDRMDVFHKLNLQPEQRNSCGSVYTPYDANISVFTAGIVQEAVLNTLLPKLPWTYAEHVCDGYNTRARRKLTPFKECRLNSHATS
ncbi:ThiF family adenylyltransferase [Vibrio splendidus]